MPKRTDIHKILIIGAGPIVIGQAAEFDYSGTQAVKALRQEGYEVVLVNSNPATIMTDPELADATYIEPLTVELLEAVIAKERPDAVLPTVGGQTALNLAVQLSETRILEKYGVQLIGASLNAMQLAEDRHLFAEAMQKAGLRVPRGEVAHSVDDAVAIAERIGRYPVLLRPSFTLGGSGAGIASDADELRHKVAFALQESPAASVLVEESVLGWKEFELEVMRDARDNFVVVCCIENLDPMGVHTGDSITVAPGMTLTDREYQVLRDMARIVMRAVGVETGGSNVQFAVHPETGEVIVIEMNPRVSRSSALASKATGFPIAKLAALLAVGYTLDELRNDITRETVAAFEPSIDYVVVKLPRWAFEKFPRADKRLGPQMRSVGEAMAIGRTFTEALMKGLQSLELGRPPFPVADRAAWDGTLESLSIPQSERIFAIWEALRSGHSAEEVARHSGVDPWFTTQLSIIVGIEKALADYRTLEDVPPDVLRHAKSHGFGDAHIAWLLNQPVFPPVKGNGYGPIKALHVRHRRLADGLLPTYHVVDTCAAEFESFTPYLYSSYESESEAPATQRDKVIILGSGPNRIGQGIEFDYCCVHAVMALRANGYEAIMVNCNPETVSTDYDTSDRLYFEPLTAEHVLSIIDREHPVKGVIVQFGGQTPLNMTKELHSMGVPILGTSPDAIDVAEDRERFKALLDELAIPSPKSGIATTMEQAFEVADDVQYPLVVRPSYVLGGRGMVIVYDRTQFEACLEAAFEASPGLPVLIDHYLEDAYEVDVDAVCDGSRVVVGGIMQHIEEAGVHSGDSACVIPPYKISAWHLGHIREYTEKLGLALQVKGLMNIQFAIKDDVVYILEVNPRASRTVPYVSKATGVPLAKVATEVILGRSLEDIGLVEEPSVQGFFVKEAVLPFKKFDGVDALLGPEMKSTGEVMGHATHFGHAFAKAQLAVGDRLPTSGTVFLSVNDFDKSAALKLARDLHRMGFQITATEGTAAFCQKAGVPVERINKVSEGSPHVVDLIREGRIHLVINTPLGRTARGDGEALRIAAVRHNVPLVTTLSAAQAAVNGVQAMRDRAFKVRSLQAINR